MATKRKSKKSERTVLLADEDVIVRLTLAEYLRHCGFRVLEAATSQEAKAILQAGEPVEILFSDAQLAGAESGFALAQWVRRNHAQVHIILQVSVAAKAAAALELCSSPDDDTSVDARGLAAKIEAMLAQRRRRTRPQQSPMTGPRRKRS